MSNHISFTRFAYQNLNFMLFLIINLKENRPFRHGTMIKYGEYKVG